MPNILLVDDEIEIQTAVTMALEDFGHRIDTADNGFEALSRLREKKYDLILTDLRMPRMDGMELVRSLQKWNEPTPVIVLTAHATTDTTARLLKAGVRDLVPKPFDLETLNKSISRILDEAGEPPVSEECARPQIGPDLFPYLMDAMQALFSTLEAREEITSAHSARVACYVLLLAKQMGLREDELRDLEFMALLHDIGKVALPEAVVLKKTRLNEAEEEMVKIHSCKGEEIVRSLRFIPGIAKAVRHHHEHYDGQGYPDGLAGDAIPLPARIIAVADIFDVRMSASSYDTSSQERVLESLRADAGKKLDPGLTEAFIDTYRAVILKKKN